MGHYNLPKKSVASPLFLPLDLAIAMTFTTIWWEQMRRPSLSPSARSMFSQWMVFFLCNEATPWQCTSNFIVEAWANPKKCRRVLTAFAEIGPGCQAKYAQGCTLGEEQLFHVNKRSVSAGQSKDQQNILGNRHPIHPPNVTLQLLSSQNGLLGLMTL